jgi:hypothetical protein
MFGAQFKLLISPLFHSLIGLAILL